MPEQTLSDDTLKRVLRVFPAELMQTLSQPQRNSVNQLIGQQIERSGENSLSDSALRGIRELVLGELNPDYLSQSERPRSSEPPQT